MKLSSTASKMALEPSVQLHRSKWNVPIVTTKTTFNNGDLVPIRALEVLPGDTISCDLSYVLRMSTPIKPVFDNVFLDVFAFFVPRRLTWCHWEEFMGANNNGPWDDNAPSYNLPQTKSPRFITSPGWGDAPESGYWYKPWKYTGTSPTLSIDQQDYFDRCAAAGILVYKSGNNAVFVQVGDTYDPAKEYKIFHCGWDVGSVAQYMGFPIGTSCEVDSGYFRAYCTIWNEFFRDQNYMNPVNTNYNSDSDDIGDFAGDPLSDGNYATLGVKGGKPLRVARFHDYFSSGLPEPQYGDAVRILNSVAPVDNLYESGNANFVTYPYLYDKDGVRLTGDQNVITSGHSFYAVPDNPTTTDKERIYLSLGADLSDASPTINDLRNAFQVQKYLERSARYGRRYTEILLGQYGVINPDYRLQRPELLCWYRKPLQMTQVLQTSSTDATSPQGNTAAYSLTGDRRSCFTKSFTEHGILLIMVATRTSRSYQQGLPRWASRRKKLDFYFPVFAHLGEQPILNREIMCHYYARSMDAAFTYPTEVFAYQEAWSEYRYMQSFVSGEFSSVGPQPLDFWHYADYYDDAVYMSDQWLFEGPENLDRTLAVTSALSHQFQADFAFAFTMVRCMPLHSIPGLADHF